jgi:hypothetical protein
MLISLYAPRAAQLLTVPQFGVPLTVTERMLPAMPPFAQFSNLLHNDFQKLGVFCVPTQFSVHHHFPLSIPKWCQSPFANCSLTSSSQRQPTLPKFPICGFALAIHHADIFGNRCNLPVFFWRAFQRSNFICMVSQLSALVCVTAAILNAIWGLHDVLPLTNSESAFRVIPIIAAAYQFPSGVSHLLRSFYFSGLIIKQI